MGAVGGEKKHAALSYVFLRTFCPGILQVTTALTAFF